MPLDSACTSSRADLDRRADEVMAAFGLAPTRANLLDVAAEMERRLHLFAGGPQLAAAIAAELRRRALRQGPR